MALAQQTNATDALTNRPHHVNTVAIVGEMPLKN